MQPLAQPPSPPQPPSWHPTLYCDDCDRRLDHSYRRLPCPWCGGNARRYDFLAYQVIHYPQTVPVSEQIVSQSRPWWLLAPVLLTAVGAGLCFVSLPPLLAAIVTVAIGIVSLFVPPWQSKIVDRIRQIV